VAWTDAELVRETLDGDRDAFGKLVDRHRRTVFALCLQRGFQPAEAEDVTQEVFIKAYKSLPSLQTSDQFGRWIYGITSHVAADAARARRRYSANVPLDAAPELAVPDSRYGHLAGGAGGDGQDRADVMRALSELPEEQRIVLTLRYLEGLSPKEIAERLGEPRGTVRSRLHHALAYLQSAFGMKEAAK
jgi:RNA polymerase sigma-70 factor (ECF subfamily)